MSDPLTSLVTAVDFSSLTTDLVTVGVAIAGFYIVMVGIKWVLHSIRRA